MFLLEILNCACFCESAQPLWNFHLLQLVFKAFTQLCGRINLGFGRRCDISRGSDLVELEDMGLYMFFRRVKELNTLSSVWNRFMFKHNCIEWATLDWSTKSLRKCTFKPLEEKKFGTVVMIIKIYCCETDFVTALISSIQLRRRLHFFCFFFHLRQGGGARRAPEE